MKSCHTCKKEKPLADFVNSKASKDGHTNFCRDCTKKRIDAYRKTDAYKQWRKDNRDRIRQWHYNFRHSEYGHEYLKRRNKIQRAKNNLQTRAYSIINQDIALGKIVRQSCVKCGNPKTDAHHPDYTKPREVIWLCRTHHNEVHGMVVH
jgi:hypothetical protein